MDCADHRICGDGDTDGAGSNLLHGVLDKKSVLEFDFQDALLLVGRNNFLSTNRYSSIMSPTSSTVYIL